MNRQSIFVGGAILVLGYVGLTKLEERVQELPIHHVSIPASGGAALSTADFYPLFSVSEGGVVSSGLDDLESAFYTPPPEPDPEPAWIPEPEPEPEQEEPRELEPVNYLARNEHLFTLNAIFVEQGAAIINGVSYKVGEYFSGGLPTRYLDEDNLLQREVLRPRVSHVSSDSVVIDASHSREWSQRLELRLSK